MVMAQIVVAVVQFALVVFFFLKKIVGWVVVVFMFLWFQGDGDGDGDGGGGGRGEVVVLLVVMATGGPAVGPSGACAPLGFEVFFKN